jgi:hypothetical protein
VLGIPAVKDFLHLFDHHDPDDESTGAFVLLRPLF